MKSLIANTPEPPYYLVSFSTHMSADVSGYEDTAQKMLDLAMLQPGYLGVESVRGANGFGITLSYWRSLEDIALWREHSEHVLARAQGRDQWYAQYFTRISKVERDYGRC